MSSGSRLTVYLIVQHVSTEADGRVHTQQGRMPRTGSKEGAAEALFACSPVRHSTTSQLAS